jgi:hypothetical protein
MMKQIKSFVFCLAWMSTLLLAATLEAGAGQVGRYEVVSVGSPETPAALILDTEHGHFWVWVMDEKQSDRIKTRLIYEGQLRTGRNSGEIIQRLESEGGSSREEEPGGRK